MQGMPRFSLCMRWPPSACTPLRRKACPCMVAAWTRAGRADLLAGRKTTGAMHGTILYSGHAPTKSFLRRHTGYVEQCGARQATCCISMTRVSMQGACLVQYRIDPHHVIEAKVRLAAACCALA